MKLVVTCMLVLASYTLPAMSCSPDTIIIRLSNDEEVIIFSKNNNEVELLENYDLNAIIRDLQNPSDSTQENIRIEIQDQTGSLYDLESEAARSNLTLEEKLERLEDKMKKVDSGGMYPDQTQQVHRQSVPASQNRRQSTYSTMMFDFGLANYLSSGRFPDETNELYSVKPLSTWNIALGVTNTTRVAGPVFVEWGANVNWYNYKFQNDRTRMEKLETGVIFFEDTEAQDPRKSNFVVPYINAQLVPMLQFGKARRDGWFPLDRDEDSGFRIGVGGYVGYRVGSKHKYVTKSPDGRERAKNRVNYYVNNWRYGVRFQLGFRSFDFYANYDLNELFIVGKGPELNAFSFGIMF